MKKLIETALMLFLLLCAAVGALADEGGAPESNQNTSSPAKYPWEFDAAVGYSSGDFGTSKTTRTVYWPFTLRRYLPEGDVSLTLPFINQKSGPGVAALSGRPFQIGTGAAQESSGGIGDLLLKGRYYLFNEETQDFSLSPIAQIKFPTADDKDRLGTGEFDETLGMEAKKMFNERWAGYGDIYYTFIGDPPRVDLNNEFAYDVGAGYHFSKETEATLFYRESTALVDNNDNPRDIILGVNHDLGEDIAVYGSLGFGLSDGSPDTSVLLGMSYWFN